MALLEFSKSAPLTMGVELELQLVNSRDCDLTRAASDVLSQVAKRRHPGEIKPEITESMIEVSTGIHTRYAPLLVELQQIRDALLEVSSRLNVGVAGGGAHPFQHWSERRIMDAPRMQHVSQLYGYLAKQFTVFGQHVHIGCADGNDALYLLHAFSRYIPHLIALSAASPYYQGVDTAFDSSRLNAVFAFPLSGRAPFVQTWDDFNVFFDKLRVAGIVESMKDFYWDIRPKPEFGTIEIRVCDTPLTVERAAALAAYAQTLARWLLVERPHRISEDAYLGYNYNRFQACRFGLEGEFIDPAAGTRRSIAEEVTMNLGALATHARELESETALREIEAIVRGGNDARWMREQYAVSGSLPDLMWRQTERLRAPVSAGRLRIGLSARILHKAPPELGFRGKTLQYLEQSIAHWLLAHDALAFMIPAIVGGSGVTRSSVSLGDYVRALDGLVLQGGADLSPESYGETAARPEWAGDRVRDLYEIELFWECVFQGKPVLGICRGLQLINVALGGTLHQDIATEVGVAVRHVDPEAYDRNAHEVEIVPGSGLGQLYGLTRRAVVNSIHHQAIRTLGRGLAVEALSPADGVIEAIRWSGASHVLGLQWHPEFHHGSESGLLDATPVMQEFLERAAQAKRAG